jgi:endonuclease YncB( thermonuclease family)/predicted flap endonuclease-1-like 5' DNA nuclease
MMWRKASNCEFAIAQLMQFRHKIGLLTLAVLCAALVDVGARGESKDWIVFENCRLIPNPANDGDSFHVSAGTKEYILRLYLVDAPETDEMTPGRLVEQAKYFGIGVPQTIEVGQAAKEFTREKLSQPFIAFTHMSDALGQSRLERFYAFVETKQGDLGEQLVRNGLARIHGYKAAPPGLRNSRVELQKLQLFEQQARQEKIGAWGVTAGRLNIRGENQSGFSSFIPAEKPRSPATPAASAAIPFSSPKPAASAPFGSTPNPSRSHAKAKTPLGRIDINTATEKELMTVPGIGRVTATRIIAARPFRSADDLKRVSGIGDKKYAQIRPYFQ